MSLTATCRIKNFRKNQNLYPQQSQITYVSLGWDTLYLLVLKFIITVYQVYKTNKQTDPEGKYASLTILWRIAGFIKNLRTYNFLGIFRILRLAGGLLWGQATRGWVRHSWGWSWHFWYFWWVIRYNFRYFYVIFRYSVGIYELSLEFWITAICIDNLSEMLE